MEEGRLMKGDVDEVIMVRKVYKRWNALSMFRYHTK